MENDSFAHPKNEYRVRYFPGGSPDRLTTLDGKNGLFVRGMRGPVQVGGDLRPGHVWRVGYGAICMYPIQDQGQPEDVGLTQSKDEDPVLGPDWAPIQDGTEPEDQSRPRFLVASEARHLADLLDSMDQTRESFEIIATVLDDDNQVLGTIQEHEDMGYVFMIVS